MKPKNKFFKSKLLFSIVGIAMLAAGCGGGSTGGSQKQVTLTMWDPFMDSQSLQPLFDAYRKNHPNVTIVYTKKDISTYQSDLLDALASGNGPDIFSINNAWLPQYLDKATAAPSSILNLKTFKDSFVDAVANDFTKDGQIYGVAMSVDSLALYYNKDLMGTAGIATPPKTWNELGSDVQLIKRQDNKGYFTRSGAALGTNANVNRAVDILYLMMLQQGTVPYSAEGQPTFAQAVQKNGNYVTPGTAGLDFYTSFANPASLNYNWNSRSDYSVDAFANGRAAFMYSYSYMRQTILQKNPNLNFDVAPVPQPNLDDPSVNFANYWGQIVSRQSRNPAAAWSFLSFLTSKDSLDTYYAQNKVPSSRRDLIALQAADPDIGVFANANLTAKSFYRPDQAKMDDIFGHVIDNVILNNVSEADALSQAQQQAAALTAGSQ
ncbi:MAG: extracellular solute-binding protein [Patescibacteria group bacterium]|nr:extracellular solute-binding protein [Patescibacteria group bacterium]